MAKNAATANTASNTTTERKRARTAFVLLKKTEAGFEFVSGVASIKAGREHVEKAQLPGDFEVHTVRDAFSAGEQKSFVLT
jgi:hypothetical protein